jgi:hypothetical protein
MNVEIQKSLQQFRETISEEALLPEHWTGKKDEVAFRVCLLSDFEFYRVRSMSLIFHMTPSVVDSVQKSGSPRQGSHNCCSSKNYPLLRMLALCVCV